MGAFNELDESRVDESIDKPEKNVRTASEALDAVDGLRRNLGAHEGGEDGVNIAAAAERAITLIRKVYQHPFMDFFAAKSV